MKKYVCLIGIYAVNMIYILGYVFPVISFSIGGIDDFFIVNYTFILIISSLTNITQMK